MNPPVPGLRTIHYDARSAAKVNLSIHPGETLTVSDDVADQLTAASPQFKDAPKSTPEPPKKKAATKKATAKKG
jgi:hypothetical protein